MAVWLTTRATRFPASRGRYFSGCSAPVAIFCAGTCRDWQLTVIKNRKNAITNNLKRSMCLNYYFVMDHSEKQM